jgi:hypothetical protein
LTLLREQLLAAGMPAWHVDVQVDFSTALSAGQASAITNTVEAVLGRPARTFDQWLQEHRRLFTA